jgi:hypothetical protein
VDLFSGELEAFGQKKDKEIPDGKGDTPKTGGIFRI